MDIKSLMEAVKASGVVDAKTGRIFGEAFATALQADAGVKAAVLAAFAAGAAAVAGAGASNIVVVPSEKVQDLLARGRAAVAANAANSTAVMAAITAVEAAEAASGVVDVTEHLAVLDDLPPAPAPEAPAPAPAPAPAEKPAAGKKAARQPAAA